MTENQFSVVVDPSSCTGTAEGLASEVHRQLQVQDIEALSSVEALIARLETGPATIASCLNKEGASELVQVLSERGISAKLSRQSQGTSPLPVDAIAEKRDADRNSTTFQGRPMATTPSSEERVQERPAGEIEWSDLMLSKPKRRPIQQEAASVEEPAEREEEPPKAGDQASPAEIVSWSDVVAAEMLDDTPHKGSGHAPSASEEGHRQAEQDPRSAQEKLSIMVGGTAENADLETSPSGPLPDPRLARIFGALAPGAGQIYLNRLTEAREYVFVGLLIKPWVEASNRAAGAAAAIASGHRPFEHSPRPVLAMFFAAAYWVVMICIILGVAGLYSRLTAPSSTMPAEIVPEATDGTDLDASEGRNALAAEFEARETEARALQFLLDANNFCNLELYVLCARAACQARDLLPSSADAAHLCLEATLAAGRQIQTESPRDDPAMAPSSHDEGEPIELGDGSGEGLDE